MSTIMPIEYYGDGKFAYVKPGSDRNFYRNAHEVISRCELWQWLSTFEPEDGGFMFCDPPSANLNRITTMIASSEVGKLHSGSSMGITMRMMQYIAKYGEVKFKEECLARYYENDDDRTMTH